MKSTISSTLSLVAGLAFAIVIMLFFTLMVGCDSADEISSGDQAAAVRAPAPAAAAVPSAPAVSAEPVAEPAERLVETPKPVTYEEAEAAYRDRDYRQARTLFAAYIEQYPDNPWGHYMFGLSAWKSEAYETAERGFLSALERDPSHVKSMLNLGRVYLDTDRPEEALVRIDSAMLLDPSFGVTHRLRGRALHELGRLAEAEDAYREAIRIDNRDAWSMNNLGLVLMQEKFFELAVAPLARATELRADVALFFNNLGMALEHTEHFRAAEAAYARAVEIDETNEKALANLTRVEAVEEDPTIGTIDLTSLAKDFEAEIVSWSDESVPREAPIAEAENAELDAVVEDKPESAVVGEKENAEGNTTNTEEESKDTEQEAARVASDLSKAEDVANRADSTAGTGGIRK